MTTIRAKFKVESVKKDDCGNEIVHMYPAIDKDNESWSKYTPGGNVDLTISNPTAQGFFKPGDFFFADFTPAPAKEADEH